MASTAGRAGQVPPPGVGKAIAVDRYAEGARLRVVLGPTNTGKTHLAVDRMLGHASGLIGCPLRLLAREIYDRIVRVRGRQAAALITGEERIVPRGARYYAATTEAIPSDLDVEFLAVDEVQLAADPERGHVFTDRLLHARGQAETMFLGSATVRPILRRILPGAEIEERPRFSTLRWSGERKLTRLPRRTAVVAFSAHDVYGIAEQMRRRHGGAAVVLGALSPRTRNAQVALYEAGEVDHLVATDAIGMGLNMDITHVAFAGRRKFDGREHRDLLPAELGQIAGRAGRHVQDGTFGTTAGCPPFDAALVEALEEHRFDPVRRLMWRSRDLDYSSTRAFERSLEAPPPDPMFVRVREADDERSFKVLARDPGVAARATSTARIRVLWDVASTPDFRKNLDDSHTNLLADIYLRLTDGNGTLPSSWTHPQVAALDRVDGSLDLLVARLDHVRVWRYVAHRVHWVEDAGGLRDHTRDVEDRLSDALHAALTRRFVDRRMATLMRRLQDSGELVGAVRRDGEVVVEGQYVGTLAGFRFTPDASRDEWDARPVRTAARKAIAQEVRGRADRLVAAADDDVRLTADGQLYWEKAPVAKLLRGQSWWRPEVKLDADDLLDGTVRRLVEQRLRAWLRGHVDRVLSPLVALSDRSLPASVRGLAWRLREEAGVLARREVQAVLTTLTRADRARLRRLGVRVGRESLDVPALRQGERGALVWMLKALSVDEAGPPPDVPWCDATTCRPALWTAAGYVAVGRVAGRVEVVEKLSGRLARRARSGPFAFDPLAETGLPAAPAAQLMGSLGYQRTGVQEGQTLWVRRRNGKRSRKGQHASPPADRPFAVLAELKASAR